MSQLCGWGILGAANIARKNWHSIFNSGNGTLVAVGSRSRERAQQFIGECQSDVAFPTPPRACSYEELLADPAIHAVYIPLPTGLRKEWVIRAAEAKKHVLCEKPCAVNASDLREMIDACQSHGVQFMDGVMFMHSQRLPKLRETLNDNASVGEVRRIAAQFTFNAGDDFFRDNIRVSNQLEPLGCLGDLGWYTTRFALWTMNYHLPLQVSGRLLQATSEGVPLQFSAELFFANNVSASLYNSFVTENQQWANVSGSKGYVHLRDFVLAHYGCEASFDITKAAFTSRGVRFNMEDHTRRVTVNEYSNNGPDSPETNLFRTFASLAIGGKIDHHWPDIALKTQQVLDACLASAREGGVLKPVV